MRWERVPIRRGSSSGPTLIPVFDGSQLEGSDLGVDFLHEVLESRLMLMATPVGLDKLGDAGQEVD